MRYVIIVASGGILGDSFTSDNLAVALAMGKALWKELTSYDTMHEQRQISVEDMEEQEEDYVAGIGAVSRFYEAHWFNDDEDVWVVQPEVIT